MAQMASDLAVTLPEDRPGMLARAVQAVSSAGINLEGHAEMEGVVHVLTSDADATRSALQSAGFRVLKEQQVVLVEVEDRPGSAASIFRRIADAKVNFVSVIWPRHPWLDADDLRPCRHGGVKSHHFTSNDLPHLTRRATRGESALSHEVVASEQ